MLSLLLLLSFSTITSVSSLSFPRTKLVSSSSSLSKAFPKKKRMFGTVSSSLTSSTTSSPPEVFGASLSDTLLDQRPAHHGRLWKNSKSSVIPSSHVRYRYIDLLDKENNSSDNASSSWHLAVQNLSSAASILCVLDCTILPFITIVFPLVKLPHALGHALALTFVLPIGSLTTLVNYYRHGRIRLLCFALLGLGLVFLANAPMSFSSFVSQTTATTTSSSLLLSILSLASVALSALHHGLLHKVTNLSGCALLMTSNYLSHQLVHKNCNC